MKRQLPKLEEEQKIWSLGHDFVVGVDEVGRGPLAGPVVAAACVLVKKSEKDLEELLDLGINDSKKLTAKKREEIFEKLKNMKSVSYSIGVVDEKTIDKINILQASLLAMKKAVDELVSSSDSGKYFVLVDGREIVPDISLSQKAIIGGDARVFSIAAASVIAKVTRDRMMEEYAKKYPVYNFEKHKGYGTKLHFQMIEEHGPCPIHRKTFLH